MNKILFCQNNRNIHDCRINYVVSHWQNVDYFIVEETDKPFSTCRLEVVFSDRRRLSIYYESLAAAWGIIHQPLFFGQMVYWFGKGYQIRNENNLLHPIIGNNQPVN